MMTSEMRKKPPETIKDLFTQNYTIVSIDAIFVVNFLYNMIPENQRPRIIEQPFLSYVDIIESQINNSSAKLAFFNEAEELMFKPNALKLKEQLFSDRIGISMKMNHPMFALITDISENLISGGVLQHIYKFYYDLAYPKMPQDLKEPEVLTIDDLRHGFIIWIVASSVTVFVFFIEIFMKIFTNWFKKLFARVMFLRVLKEIVELKTL